MKDVNEETSSFWDNYARANANYYGLQRDAYRQGGEIIVEALKIAGFETASDFIGMARIVNGAFTCLVDSPTMAGHDPDDITLEEWVKALETKPREGEPEEIWAAKKALATIFKSVGAYVLTFASPAGGAVAVTALGMGHVYNEVRKTRNHTQAAIAAGQFGLLIGLAQYYGFGLPGFAFGMAFGELVDAAVDYSNGGSQEEQVKQLPPSPENHPRPHPHPAKPKDAQKTTNEVSKPLADPSMLSADEKASLASAAFNLLRYNAAVKAENVSKKFLDIMEKGLKERKLPEKELGDYMTTLAKDSGFPPQMYITARKMQDGLIAAQNNGVTSPEIQNALKAGGLTPDLLAGKSRIHMTLPLDFEQVYLLMQSGVWQFIRNGVGFSATRKEDIYPESQKSPEKTQPSSIFEEGARLTEKSQKEAGYSPSKDDTLSALSAERARSWAADTGRDPAEYYEGLGPGLAAQRDDAPTDSKPKELGGAQDQTGPTPIDKPNPAASVLQQPAAPRQPVVPNQPSSDALDLLLNADENRLGPGSGTNPIVPLKHEDRSGKGGTSSNE